MPQRPLKLLIIDDDEADMTFFRSAIKSIGVPVRLLLEPNSCDALTTIERDRPDLIVLDINMPGVTGLEVLKQIKSHPDYILIPVIIMSTSENPRDIEECYRSGANAYITKPFTPDGYDRMALHLTNFWCAEAKLS